MDRRLITGRMVVAALLPLLFLLVMSFHYIPKLLHEVIGLLWLVAVMVHVWQNRGWFKTLVKGHWNLFRGMNALVDLSLLVVLFVTVLAGTGISNFIFKETMPLDIQRSIMVHQLHVSLPYAMLILMGLHWGLHFSGWLKQWQQGLNLCWSAKLTRLLYLMAGSLIVAVGIYGSVQNRIGDRLLLKHIFATPATSEPWALYIVMMLGIMGMYVLVGALARKILLR